MATSLYLSQTSNSSVSSSNTKVEVLVSQLNKESIRSISIGVNEIRGNILYNDLTHTSLFLSKNKAKDLDNRIGNGILIEYGYFSPNINDTEKNYVNDGYVIYRYGNEGGLRYYMQNMPEFIETKCDLCYVCLDIYRDNQISFSYFLDKIAPKNDDKWTNKNNTIANINSEHNNSQDFVASALHNLLKPKEYDRRMVKKGHKFPFNYKDDNENIFPKDVLDALKVYEN